MVDRRYRRPYGGRHRGKCGSGHGGGRGHNLGHGHAGRDQRHDLGDGDGADADVNHVSPATATLFVGTTGQFKAQGTYSDLSTADLTDSVTWSTGTTTVASVSNAAGTRGLVTALAVGTSNLVASLSGVVGTAIVTVSVVPLVSIAVTPNPLNLPLGLTLPLKATATYGDKTTQDVTTSATWTVGDSSIATVGNVGNRGGSGHRQGGWRHHCDCDVVRDQRFGHGERGQPQAAFHHGGTGHCQNHRRSDAGLHRDRAATTTRPRSTSPPRSPGHPAISLWPRRRTQPEATAL